MAPPRSWLSGLAANNVASTAPIAALYGLGIMAKHYRAVESLVSLASLTSAPWLRSNVHSQPSRHRCIDRTCEAMDYTGVPRVELKRVEPLWPSGVARRIVAPRGSNYVVNGLDVVTMGRDCICLYYRI